MTPTEISAHAIELGITPEAFPELWKDICEHCGGVDGIYAVNYGPDESDTRCGYCQLAPTKEVLYTCILPAPDSADPRACLWDGFYMRALGWPNLGNYGEFYECLVACGDMMLSSHRGPTPTAALRAAWLAKGASK